MGELLLEACWLLVVGMGSAFFVLFLIGVLGRLLIRWTNLQVEKISSATSPLVPHAISENQHHVAVIAAVVDSLTDGEGHVDTIQKIKS